MKFLFLVNDLNVSGGVASALVNLSNTLIKEGHDVSFLNFTNTKELPIIFDSKIKLINLNKREQLINLNNCYIKRAPLVLRPYLFILGLIKKILNRGEGWHKFCFKKTFLTGFDVAIAFRQSPLNYWFVKNKTDAKVKIGFWHGDPDFMDGIDKWAYTIKYLDYVACVSNAVKEKMKIRYPKFSDKMTTVYNIFNDSEIKQKAVEFNVDYNKNLFNIVTVARIDFEQKQLQFIPIISKSLKAQGYLFHWYIVGGGADFCTLQQLIQSNEVSDCVELIGEQKNPYPYIKNADLFVLTSIWESYGMVLTESLILGVPCIAGDYPALQEIIDNNVNGLIADNSIDGIKEKIEEVIKNKELYNKLKTNAKNYKYDYKIAYNQLINLCEENDKI